MTENQQKLKEAKDKLKSGKLDDVIEVLDFILEKMLNKNF